MLKPVAMRHQATLLFTVFIFLSNILSAQKNLIDSAIKNNKTQAQLKVINGASDKVNKGIDDLLNGNAFKRKNKTAKPASKDSLQQQVLPSTMEIDIDSIDYNLLSHYSEILKLNPHVKEVKPQFSKNQGILKITYSGDSQEVLNDLLKKADGKLTVDEINDDKITLKTKG